jgi:hypothetical protein
MSRRFLGIDRAVIVGTILSAAGRARSAGPSAAENPPPPGWIDPRKSPKEDPNCCRRTPDGQPNFEGQWGQASDIITYSIETRKPNARATRRSAANGR